LPIRIGSLATLALASGGPAWAQSAGSTNVLDKVVVEGLSLEETVLPTARPVESVMGDDRSILETPRSVSLVTKAQIKPWETVLIFGIGGGVSLAAMQLAKAMGVRVIVTSRDDHKLERALTLGADHTINSQTQDVAKAVMAFTDGRGVDVVIENVGQAVWSAAMKSLVRGGRLVTCGATSGDQPPADLRRIFIRQLQILGSTHGNFAEFHDMLAFVTQHGIQPVIDHEYPIDQVHAALDRLASQQQFGKVGLNLQPE
jgi:NADPH:quinone reductase-like Zn-dependent oxidoreductase